MRADLRRTAYQFQFPSRISLPDDATQEAFRYGHSFGRQPPFSILFLGAWESPGGRKDYAKGVTVTAPGATFKRTLTGRRQVWRKPESWNLSGGVITTLFCRFRMRSRNTGLAI